MWKKDRRSLWISWISSVLEATKIEVASNNWTLAMIDSYKILYSPSQNSHCLSSESTKRKGRGVLHFISDFQCFVCGAIFTTDEDRKLHLETESKGMLIASSQEERDTAAMQEAMNNNRKHYL